MGAMCANTSLDRTQVSITLPQRLKENNLKTQLTIEEFSQSFLDIGQEITSLGVLRPEVQQVLQQLGNYARIENFTFVSYNDGSIFQGEVKDGIRQGAGRQHWVKEGNYLEGFWNRDRVNGPARMIYPNGDVFEGNMLDNKANGFGVFKNKNKEVRGYWIDNKLQGNGTELRKNGIKYEGQFQSGMIEGRGQFTFPDGRKYVGEVHNGQIHGSGVMTWPDLSYFKGDFRCNAMKGYGCYTDVDCQVYRGYFFSVYHPDEKKLEIFYCKDPNIQECNKLKKFKKQYGSKL